MSMRRYALNSAVLGAAAGIVPAIRQSIRGPRDWKLALVWVGWGINVAIAIGTVIDQVRADREAEELEALGLTPPNDD